MTILFAGGEMGALIPSDATSNEVTTSGTYDTNFARCAAAANGSTGYLETPEWSGQTDIWVHFEIAQAFATSTSTVQQTVTLMNSSGAELIRLACSGNNSTGDGTWALQLWNGASWATLGSTFDAGVLQKQVVDIHITCNSATGVADLYLSGTKRISNSSVNLSTVANIAQARFYGKTPVIPSIQKFSQILVQTTSTIGRRLMTIPPTANGATDQWTGSYTAVDEAIYSDSDFEFSDTADQVQLYAGTPVGSLTGYNVAAVVVTARAKKDGSGPQNLRLAVRTNSTTYASGSDLPLDAGYGAFVGIWETNPNTTQAWTAAEAAAIQFGVKSIA